MDDGLDWHYAFVCLSSTTCHVALSHAGHLGAMTDGVWSINACGCLHQLQTWKLLQHEGKCSVPQRTKWGEIYVNHTLSLVSLAPASHDDTLGRK